MVRKTAGLGDAVWEELSEFANSLYVMTEINSCNLFFFFFTMGVGTCTFHMVFAVNLIFSASTLGCKQ